jgi:hypothetical protein
MKRNGTGVGFSGLFYGAGETYVKGYETYFLQEIELYLKGYKFLIYRSGYHSFYEIYDLYTTELR